MVEFDYDEFNATLIAAQAGVRASECHGFLCGQFCAGSALASDSWQEYLLASIDTASMVDDCVVILQELAQQVKLDILSETISFQLFLPEDTAAMSERTRALAEWCAGFASGVGLGDIADKEKLNTDCDEFIKDVVAISKVETAIDEGDEVEKAFVEIMEYVRIGTIMLYQELNQVDIQVEKQEVLH